MHHRRILSRTTSAALAVGASSLLLASGAHAATTLLPADIDALPRAGAVESGEITIKLSGAGAKLKSSLKGAGEVKVKGSTVTLLADPDAEAWIDPTIMQGSVGIDGSLSIKGKSKTAKLTDITFSPGKEKNVTAKLGKKVITLGKLTGGKSTFAKQADGLLKGAKFSLGSAGVKAINKVTGGGVSAGSFGTVEISVTTRELPLASGTATVTIDPSVVSTLNANGYGISAVAPATLEGNNVVKIPLVAGAFDPSELTGRLKLDGTVHLANAAGDKKIDLFGWRAAVSSTQHDLYAQINQSVAAAIGVLDLSAVNAQLDNKSFSATGAKVTFSKIAVSTLKQSFGVDMAVGAPLATVDMSGTISGTF